jgi:hypothetical protein
MLLEDLLRYFHEGRFSSSPDKVFLGKYLDAEESPLYWKIMLRRRIVTKTAFLDSRT